MTRGRRPLMALREAVLIAKKRGETRQFMHEPGTICNFVIYCQGFVAHVPDQTGHPRPLRPCMDRA